MLIIAGTIAMLGGGIMGTEAPVQDAFVKMIGPIGAPLVSYGALISIAVSTSVNPLWFLVSVLP